MSLYDARYTYLLQKAEVDKDLLPGDLLRLVEKYRQAAGALEQADRDTRLRLLYILVQTDAAICAAIYSLYKDRLSITDVIAEHIAPPTDTARQDKIKLLALKAKALKQKWAAND